MGDDFRGVVIRTTGTSNYVSKIDQFEAGVRAGGGSQTNTGKTREVQVTGNAGTNAQAHQIAIPRNTSARAIDLMEFVVWDRALNSDELTAEYSNLTASYGL